MAENKSRTAEDLNQENTSRISPLPEQEPCGNNERPPFFNRWRGWYQFVLVILAVLIVLFYLFTKHYD
ncbi:hypothetical protein SAMN05192529_10819 [Arachidicoccus rhizosphaerae]|uniref:Uncharacterized protein n=1 Tax=Arachidicoccus rhizosphaerae TaxID=551991 RepID=A0A1H3YDE9_9BACT|nr:hypothetical protein [Arachidicoccus rhizosphaerae]SEA09635.1 hypothetical protein SAMN05192529_10819 [Arachidicoccus rhizosphaerae]